MCEGWAPSPAAEEHTLVQSREGEVRVDHQLPSNREHSAPLLGYEPHSFPPPAPLSSPHHHLLTCN